jgi:RimJ/RimL family protein N-acetyltransferase
MDAPQVFIETPRLILRQWTASDEEPYIQMNQDTDVMEFFPSMLSTAETLAQIERISLHISQYGYGFFAMERKDNHKFIGFTGLSHPGFESYFTPCVEIGWRLNRASWNKGYATEAARACLKYGLQTLNLGEIYSFTSVYNVRSEQVMIRAGMVREGVFDHPLIEEGNILRRHVLYKISRQS